MKHVLSITALMLALGTAHAQADMDFDDADADGNGAVSLLEAQEAGIEDFDRHDLNEDGLLDEDEYRMAQRSAAAGSGAAAETGEPMPQEDLQEAYPAGDMPDPSEHFEEGAPAGPNGADTGEGQDLQDTRPPGDLPDPAIQFEEDEPAGAQEY